MKKQMFDNIEVAVRLRPLNHLEILNDPEGAWQIKNEASMRQLWLNSSSKKYVNRMNMEILGEDQGRVLMLKTKYRGAQENSKSRAEIEQ